MSDIVIVDSCVLLNVLDVPGFNQHRDDVFQEFVRLVDAENHLLLPMAAVLETGDHVADLSDGKARRRYAERFRDCIHEALDGKAPWTPIEFPETSQLLVWLADFPDMAMQEFGVSDMSIIDAWERQRTLHPHRRVYVWTLHQRLRAYTNDHRA